MPAFDARRGGVVKSGGSARRRPTQLVEEPLVDLGPHGAPVDAEPPGRLLVAAGQCLHVRAVAAESTELYVPRLRLPDFLAEMRTDFREHAVDLIYASVRLIERDDETFLAWAREPWACVVLNLHVVHTPNGLAHAAAAFRRLIDMAAIRGGTYYLTYHRWATRAQVEACHPRLAEFLRLKRAYDPAELLQSDWYRHHRDLFAT